MTRCAVRPGTALKSLPGAVQASDVPVKPENIDEMIVLMDLDRDGVISWKEFVTFFM